MDQETLAIFLILVFAVVFLLGQFMIVPIFSTRFKQNKRLKQRMGDIAEEYQPDNRISLVRSKFLRKPTPLEKRLESLPGMSRLEKLIEHSGHELPAYHLVLWSFLLALAGGQAAWVLTNKLPAVIVVATLLAGVPVIKLKVDFSKRLNKFEEQLPDALDMMTRAMKAGHPLTETLHLVATEMDEPIAKEFRIVFDELNFGADIRWSLKNMVERVPSMSLMAVVTTILVQKETGGNLTETFENNGRLIRERFKFQRRVSALTAEARMSSWVMSMVPFGLFAVMSVLNPGYIMVLLREPLGQKLIFACLGLFVIGNVWIRRIITSMDI